MDDTLRGGYDIFGSRQPALGRVDAEVPLDRAQPLLDPAEQGLDLVRRRLAARPPRGARLPRAMVIGVDADPVSLSLGRAAYGDVPGLRFEDLDLRVPGWSARLGLNLQTRAPDAAVSTTALHWLPEPDLRALDAELASVNLSNIAPLRE